MCPQCEQPFYHKKSQRRFCSKDCYTTWQSHHPNVGSFKQGVTPVNHVEVGTVRVRTRKGRGGVQRAWVKITEPNVWRLRAKVVWEAENGPIPRGTLIHHHNRNALDDRIGNLALVTRAEHLMEHRPEFEHLRLAGLRRQRARDRLGL